ncbi:MAG: serine/threonine protein kinase [Deltaproteobacteria bacterium]|nr:serine/threonine protein kinase [Deltaproteobacteria bacterium]MBT6489698.1 serine/threonine protein kinase [Deltaproteobacteria bacterium]
MVEKDNDSKKTELVRLNARHPFAQRIGTGVGSEIFLAMQQGESNTFQRLVAVKKVAALFGSSGENELIREIRAAAGLSHPNIVRIYGAEKSGARLLVSMEYVFGHRLSTLMTAMREREIEFPVPILLRMMVQACEALHHAHSARGLDQAALNLVHRDVCPENMMLDVHGYLRIVDFGLAKLKGGEDTTIPGRVKGRFLYMPLEQMRGDPIDNRSDIYSLGMTFYELATLRAPREARNIKAAYDEALGQQKAKPISTLSSCPRELDVLFEKATATLPADRYQTAREFSLGVEEAAKQTQGLASIADTERWLETHFSDLRKRREAFERNFAQSVEQAQVEKSEVSVPTLPVEEVQPSAEVISVEEKTTRWLIVSLCVFVAALIAVTTHYLTRERQTISFTEGFQIETDASEASIFVLSIPERALLYVDDSLVGKVSRLGVTVRLEPKKNHKLRLELEGYKPYEVLVEGQAGVADQLIAQLEPVGKMAPKVPSNLGKREKKMKRELLNEEVTPEAPSSEVQETLPKKASAVQPAPIAAEPQGQVKKPPARIGFVQRGLHPIEWGMNKRAVKKVLAGMDPEKTTGRVDSYRGQFYGLRSIQNFVYLDSGLGAVIYLLPQTELSAGEAAFNKVLAQFKLEFGEPKSEQKVSGNEWQVYWSHSRGELLLVWNSKKKLSQALKVMYLSMPWLELQKQLGNMP